MNSYIASRYIRAIPPLPPRLKWIVYTMFLIIKLCYCNIWLNCIHVFYLLTNVWHFIGLCVKCWYDQFARKSGTLLTRLLKEYVAKLAIFYVEYIFFVQFIFLNLIMVFLFYIRLRFGYICQINVNDNIYFNLITIILMSTHKFFQLYIYFISWNKIKI